MKMKSIYIIILLLLCNLLSAKEKIDNLSQSNEFLVTYDDSEWRRDTNPKISYFSNLRCRFLRYIYLDDPRISIDFLIIPNEGKLPLRDLRGELRYGNTADFKKYFFRKYLKAPGQFLYKSENLPNGENFECQKGRMSYYPLGIIPYKLFIIDNGKYQAHKPHEVYLMLIRLVNGLSPEFEELLFEKAQTLVSLISHTKPN